MNMSTNLLLTGGCLCGAIRYELDGALIDAGYCHCRMCQRASGAPVVAWATFPIECFRYTAQAPAINHSSAQYQREFCSQCGTPLVFRRRTGATMLDITLASLDNPPAITPQYHIWCMSQLKWFETADSLPRHAESGPDPS